GHRRTPEGGSHLLEYAPHDRWPRSRLRGGEENSGSTRCSQPTARTIKAAVRFAVLHRTHLCRSRRKRKSYGLAGKGLWGPFQRIGFSQSRSGIGFTAFEFTFQGAPCQDAPFRLTAFLFFAKVQPLYCPKRCAPLDLGSV